MRMGLLVVAALTTPTSVGARSVAAAQDPAGAEARNSTEPLASRLARIGAEAAARGVSGQMLAVQNGVPVFEAAYGTVAETEAAPPITPETVFAIGSVTKQFTRVAVLALEEDGLLSRSDRLGDLLPGVPADKTAITVDQLLKMSAGFHEYHDDDGDHQPMSKPEALERILGQALRFEPGSDRAYSNSGFTLLAAIAEEVSGESFADYVRERLLNPLGLDRIGFHGDDRWADADVARGLGGDTFGANAPHTWPAPTWALQGAGGMVASARDLSRWILALRGGEVLGPEALEAAYSGPEAFYAGGDDFGFVTAIVEMDGGLTHVVTATNSGGPASEEAVHLMIEAMTGRPSPFGGR
ncbi:MAG: beta-lactamase family protein [Gemmatimonadetes bacterium]|nr:beta-lactamase family protein [Gemmatimonadota bacterium]